MPVTWHWPRLHFLQAPHVYKAQGEALEQTLAIDAADNDGRGHCWWNATDDPELGARLAGIFCERLSGP